MNIRKATAKDFEIIPGIGKKLSQELFDLGYRKVSELKGEDPEIMYQNLRLCSHQWLTNHTPLPNHR